MAAGLIIVDTSIDDLTVRSLLRSPEPDSFDVTATLQWRQATDSFATSCRVKVAILDGGGRGVGEVAVRTTTRFRGLDFEGVEADAAKTFALSFGSLEPIALAAQTMVTALAILGIRAEVAPSPTLALNTGAVYETSSQPPMSSDTASPLNPYALEGIPGDQAERWAEHGFSAAVASAWARDRFDPTAASGWTAAGFAPEAARDWADLGAEPDDAADYSGAGIAQETVADAILQGFDPLDLLALLGVVPIEEMAAWMQVVQDRDLIEPSDVDTLVSSGLTVWDVEGAPEDLTALEIVQFNAGGFEPDHLDDGDEQRE